MPDCQHLMSSAKLLPILRVVWYSSLPFIIRLDHDARCVTTSWRRSWWFADRVHIFIHAWRHKVFIGQFFQCRSRSIEGTGRSADGSITRQHCCCRGCSCTRARGRGCDGFKVVPKVSSLSSPLSLLSPLFLLLRSFLCAVVTHVNRLLLHPDGQAEKTHHTFLCQSLVSQHWW